MDRGPSPRLDRDELIEKYRIERDKRIRADGNDQYVQPTGRFAHLLDDPHLERVERAPVDDDVDVAIIGGGFAGLVTGARLRERGVQRIRILEGGGDVGGAWYWNRYPGAMCDTAAMVYLPLLEETGYLPSAKYVPAAEIFAHARRIAETFDLYRDALLATHVTSLDWDEEAARWIVRTDRDDAVRARFVTIGTGPLHRPKLPGIPGIDLFEGHTFHTSRWDYRYTGGDAAGAPMDRLVGRRVGIIGTGATAVQAVPHLARSAGELYVFQRTPSSVDVRANRELGAEDFADLRPGWQREWLLNFATLQTGGFTDEDYVEDGWTDISRRIRDRIIEMVADGAELTPELMTRAYEDCDDDKMGDIRDRIDSIVADPATAEGLKPWYRQLCKRPCFHDEYLQAFNEPGVHLVDTDGRGVTRIDADGAWVGERHYGLDCIIFASGFDVGTAFARRSGFETTGRDGLTLSDAWNDGMVSLHGMHVRGFPNLFVIGLTQGANLVSNITHNLTEAATTTAAVIAHAITADAHRVEVSVAAQDAWMALIDGGPGSFLGNLECTPGYYNNEGATIGRRQRRGMSGHPGGPVAYFAHIEAWRTSGDFEGLEFS